jgi:hypothetical protein
MLAINDIITDSSGRSFRLVGLEQGTAKWIVQPVDFGSPFVAGDDLLRDEFGVTGTDEDKSPAADPYEVETAGWAALAAAERASHEADAEAEPTPEDRFNIDYQQRVTHTRGSRKK